MATTYQTTPGQPLPLGATVTPEGINFAVCSRNAAAAYLDLFDAPQDGVPCASFELDAKRHKTGDIFHIFVKGLKPRQLYGWRMNGPYRPVQGHRFNANKLLIDPFARAVCGSFDMYDGDIYGYDKKSAMRDRSFSSAPSAHACAKSVAMETAPADWDADARPRYPLSESIIYECHVKGMTMHPSSGSACPGTYLGIIDKIPHLLEMGVTAVELLPVAAYNTQEPPTLKDPETGKYHTNYWGYATLGFFSPHQGYACDKAPGAAVREFRAMVKACHEAQIEVILDVVFNHSGEGNELGPTIAFRGLDNAVYYMLQNRGKYANYTGCGNTMNCSHPVMKHLIIECLRYWMIEMHVDGFRFDLATILGRSAKGEWINDPNLGLLSDIAQDPVLSGAKLIAEAWDAAGLYKVGGFPTRWAEWNGKFRDDVRRFWTGANDTVAPIAARIAGSKDIFVGKPDTTQSINFITAHDGFTLRDLCSYSQKHNIRNGENNRDGSDANISMNFGIEGETDDESIIRKRLQHAKNLIATLFISRGTPMLLGGDEIWRTQKGNNNGFCQDNDISWIDWTRTPQSDEIMRFAKKIIALRKRFKALHQTSFADPFKATFQSDNMRFHGVALDAPDWASQSHSIALELADGPHEPRFYIAMNAWREPLAFELPKRAWYALADTARPAPFDIYALCDAPRVKSSKISVRPDSMIILISAGCAQQTPRYPSE